jgi:hypothetical protein
LSYLHSFRIQFYFIYFSPSRIQMLPSFVLLPTDHQTDTGSTP